VTTICLFLKGTRSAMWQILYMSGTMHSLCINQAYFCELQDPTVSGAGSTMHITDKLITM
jgi:hypothetical protein